MPYIISIIGKSKSGKTTLVEKLIPVLKRRGYRIGTVKHAFHGFEVDKKGKDSYRHKAAGADTVILSSPGKIALVKDTSCDSLDCLEAYLQDMDIVIAEGYKKEDTPKIEVFLSEKHRRPLFREGYDIIAFVTDLDIKAGVPKFDLGEIEKLADLIEKMPLK
ncbi:MAG TPA: molybdopterin-guanine dinucleotide biosynthesis protein B [Desulfobacteraceae bacterium]|nr:molybdopterin-guanine dinucleotide biosynthesis protein B [Desulfobacteraceae bacterium]